MFNLNNQMEGAKNVPIPKIRLPSSSFDIPEDKADQAWDTVSSNLTSSSNIVCASGLTFSPSNELLSLQ